MLTIEIVTQEGLNSNNEFVVMNSVSLHLEHSLASLSKWESIWQKPFLGPDEKTIDETIGYIKVMTLNEVPPEVYDKLSKKNLKAIQEYVGSKMTATWFPDMPQTGSSREIITAEIIYYWMLSLNIPIECEHWHLNKLMTLVRVYNAKNGKQKKTSRHELAARNRAINEQRKRELNTSG